MPWWCKEWVCNGFSECRDNSDETDEVCKEYNRTAEENNDKEDDDDICVDGFLKCPGEMTCALACDTLIDCRVVEGYDETVEIGCVHACTRRGFEHAFRFALVGNAQNTFFGN